MYAIVDIETTGGYAKSNKITEIAIYIHDGNEIIDSFSSLINPERSIPPSIVSLTGITNEMVASAPKFYEVAKQVFQITEGNIFVAHNVSFDYNFIRNEFRELGADFRRKKLCTVRLSRKVFPGLPSYSLGNLCSSLNIKLEDRHRAHGDALATTILFKMILDKDINNSVEAAMKKQSREAILPPNLSKKIFDKIPESTGVYFFHNAHNEIIYIGKAINIRKRVISHFSGSGSRKHKMKNEIHDVTFEETGSELVALLLEADQVKKKWPYFNRALKLNKDAYALSIYHDQLGYQRWVVDQKKKLKQAAITFASKGEATKFIYEKIKEYNLCPKLCGMQPAKKECFYVRLSQCDGACCGKVLPEEYNVRMKCALHEDQDERSFVIIEKGRNRFESSIIAMENGAYIGYSYLENDQLIEKFDDLLAQISPQKDNTDIQRIIWSYLRNNENANIVFKADSHSYIE